MKVIQSLVLLCTVTQAKVKKNPEHNSQNIQAMAHTELDEANEAASLNANPNLESEKA